MSHKRKKRNRTRKKHKTKKNESNLSSNIRAIQYPSIPLSREELDKVFLEAGKKHQSEFDTLLPKVIEILCSCHPLHVLSTLSVYGLSVGITKTGKMRRKEYGSLTQAHVELAQALILTIPPDEILFIPISPQKVQEVWDSLISLGSSFSYKRMTQVSSMREEKEKIFSLLQEHIRLNTQYVRNWGYYKQTIRLIKEIYGPLDKDFTRQVGMSATQIITMFEYLVTRTEKVVNDWRDELKDVLKSPTLEEAVRRYYKVYPDMKDSPEQLIEFFHEQKIPKEGVMSFILSHSDLRLPEKLTFSIEEIAKELLLDAKDVEKCISLLSLSYGDLSGYNLEHLFLDNPVWTRPLLKIDENTCFCSIPQMFFSFSLNILDGLLSSDAELKAKCSQRRAKFLQDKIFDLATCSFPGCQCEKNFKWNDGSNEYETDFLIKVDSFLIIVEAKSGSITMPALRGAPKRILRHVKEQIIDPAIQSQRLIDKILETQSISAKTDVQFPFDIKEIRQVIRISVTLEDFGNILSNLGILKDSGLFDEEHIIAPTIPIAAFESILEILELQEEKVHYLLRRNVLEQEEISLLGDELDWLGLYLENGLNMTSVESKNIKLQLFEMARPIDDYYSAQEHGVVVKKPALKSIKWWRDIRNRIREKAPSRWLEACVALLDFPVDEQVVAEKSFRKIKKNVKKNWLRPGHINSVVISPPVGKTDAVALLAFREKHKEKRYDFMESIADKVFSERHVKCCVVIGVNIDENEYPYSIFGMFDRAV